MKESKVPKQSIEVTTPAPIHFGDTITVSCHTGTPTDGHLAVYLRVRCFQGTTMVYYKVERVVVTSDPIEQNFALVSSTRYGTTQLTWDGQPASGVAEYMKFWGVPGPDQQKEQILASASFEVA